MHGNRLLRIIKFSIACKDDDVKTIDGQRAFQHFKAVHLRHAYIRDDDVRASFDDLFQPAFSIARAADDRAAHISPRQRPDQPVTDHILILDDHHPQNHSVSPSSPGRLKTTSVVRPCCVWMHMP